MLRVTGFGTSCRYLVRIVQKVVASRFADRPVAVRPQPVGACRWARLRPRTWTGGHEARPSTFLAIQEDILLRMEDIINGAGSGFAFPSQTAYLAHDGGLDDERISEAVAEVEQWRAGGKLPFPEFENQQREQIEDVLDYPPEGSPGHQPRAGRSSTE